MYRKACNRGAEEKQKVNGTVEYQIVKAGTTEKVLEHSQPLASIPGASSSQVTLEQVLPLKGLQPGQYTLKIKVTDDIKKQSLSPDANFTVN